MEDFCVKTLEYKLDNPTLYELITFFLNHGVIFENEDLSEKKINQPDHLKLKNFFDYSYKLLQTIIENESELFSNVSVYEMALAVMKISREKFNLSPKITEGLIRLYSLESSMKIWDYSKLIEHVLEKERILESSSRLEKIEKKVENFEKTEKFTSPIQTEEITIETRRHSVNQNWHCRRLSNFEVNVSLKNSTNEFLHLNSNKQTKQIKSIQNNSASSNGSSTCSNGSSTSIPKYHSKTTSSNYVLIVKMQSKQNSSSKLTYVNNLRFPRASGFSKIKIGSSVNLANNVLKSSSISNRNLPIVSNRKENPLMIIKYL